MSPIFILALMGGYFLALFLIGKYTAGSGSNETFFSANRDSAWWLVAFGMIGTSLSGVTFISVPGKVSTAGFGYFQVVLGYIVGYLVIAFVLMPLYYRLNLVSIYGYLRQRIGYRAYKTGAWVFLVSRSLGSAARFYLVLSVLHLAVFQPLGVPFWLSVIIGLLLIWLYTYQGGIKTIIITDTLQTACMLISLGLCLYMIAGALGTSMPGLLREVMASSKSQIINYDVNSPGYFWKQFVAGAFIAIVMTGLDQDMMQKNLTCRNLREAQTNMLTFTAILVGVNFLFLVLGGALYLFAQRNGIAIPVRTDDLFPIIALTKLGAVAGVVFILGIIAATYASTDSALTALTTSYCIDILELDKRPGTETAKTRTWVHLGMTGVMFVLVYIFRIADKPALVDVVFTLAGYTYGPLLGMFSFGILTRRVVNDKVVPYICLASPLVCLAVDYATKLNPGGYHFGFELLLINGALTFAGLWVASTREAVQQAA